MSIDTEKYSFEIYENYIFHESTLHRRQMSTAGAYLESRCKGGRGIDVVADKKVHHTIGNIMPVPEGANAGMPGNDIYYDKLLFIKKNIESMARNECIITDREVENVNKRIGKVTLGNYRGKEREEFPPFHNGLMLRYWLNDEGRGWITDEKDYFQRLSNNE